MNSIFKRSFYYCVVLILATVAGFGQGNVVRTEMTQAEIDRILKKVTENEGAFRVALRSYAFKRYATINEIGLGGQFSGTYRRDSYMTFNSEGVRFEKILFAPLSTLPNIQITPEDLEDLGGVNPYALEPSMASQYKFNYVGTERIDELNLYVFDVAPKVAPDANKTKLRYFTGRIWVDVDDLMIIQTKGKAVPEGKERFPIVTTIRGSVDKKFYFPIYSSSNGADGTLVFPSGQVVKTTFKVTYKNYRLGRSEVRILDDDEPEPTPKK